MPQGVRTLGRGWCQCGARMAPVPRPPIGALIRHGRSSSVRSATQGQQSQSPEAGVARSCGAPKTAPRRRLDHAAPTSHTARWRACRHG
eukprot:scaffold26779_cov63-Phaeocystis_antarctica.AAC.3